MSIATAPLHTIRMSTQDWNELLVTAINAGYKNRTEYIRAALKGDKLWSSEQPPDNSEVETLRAKWQASTASLEIITNDAVRFLERAEAAEAKTNELQAEIAKLRDTAQATPIMENPHSTQSILATRPSLKSITDSWPEKKLKRWNDEKWKCETWCKDVLDTAYAIMDHGA